MARPTERACASYRSSPVRSNVPPVSIEHQRLCQAGIVIRIAQITRHAHQTSSVGVGSHRCVKATSMHGAESDWRECRVEQLSVVCPGVTVAAPCSGNKAFRLVVGSLLPRTNASIIPDGIRAAYSPIANRRIPSLL